MYVCCKQVMEYGKLSHQCKPYTYTHTQVYRVYYDRLVDAKDRAWLFELMQKMVKQHFKEDFHMVFKHLAQGGGSKVTDDDMRSLLFGDYMQPDAVS